MIFSIVHVVAAAAAEIVGCVDWHVSPLCLKTYCICGCQPLQLYHCYSSWWCKVFLCFNLCNPMCLFVLILFLMCNFLRLRTVANGRNLLIRRFLFCMNDEQEQDM